MTLAQNRRDNIDFTVDHLVSVHGVYCIICELEDECCISVGSLGKAKFRRGAYVYVGSAQQGIEQRGDRHRSNKKKHKWHIDYFLGEADVKAVIAVPSEVKETECKLAKAILAIPGASAPISGFGSSDCGCDSHLAYLGDEGLESASESVVYHLSMLGCMYPEKMTDASRRGRKRR